MRIEKHKPQKFRKPLVIGLTGSIGMGKTTVASLLRAMKFPIYSADRAVHDLLKKDGRGVKPVADFFPESLKRGSIDRKILGSIVFQDRRKLRQLERIVHPLLRQVENVFLKQARKNKAEAVILEIPLLFETGADKRCDVTMCVTASTRIQKSRVMSRTGMTPQRLRSILKLQMSDKDKRRRADYVISTNVNLAHTEKHLKLILKTLELLA